MLFSLLLWGFQLLTCKNWTAVVHFASYGIWTAAIIAEFIMSCVLLGCENASGTEHAQLVLQGIRMATLACTMIVALLHIKRRRSPPGNDEETQPLLSSATGHTQHGAAESEGGAASRQSTVYGSINPHPVKNYLGTGGDTSQKPSKDAGNEGDQSKKKGRSWASYAKHIWVSRSRTTRARG